MAVAGLSPIVKFIRATHADDIGIDGVRAGECPSLAGMNRVSLAAAGRFTFPTAYGHEGRVSVLARLDSILTGLQDGERLIGRVHFINFVAPAPWDRRV